MTALCGSRPAADHGIELEQTWVLEVREDHEGAVTAGNYVWRPAGSRHDAHAPNGCLTLSFFLKPNKFFDKPAA